MTSSYVSRFQNIQFRLKRKFKFSYIKEQKQEHEFVQEPVKVSMKFEIWHRTSAFFLTISQILVNRKKFLKAYSLCTSSDGVKATNNFRYLCFSWVCTQRSHNFSDLFAFNFSVSSTVIQIKRLFAFFGRIFRWNHRCSVVFSAKKDNSAASSSKNNTDFQFSTKNYLLLSVFGESRWRA